MKHLGLVLPWAFYLIASLSFSLHAADLSKPTVDVTGALDNDGHFYLNLHESGGNRSITLALTQDGKIRREFRWCGIACTMLSTPFPLNEPYINKLIVAPNGNLWLFYSYYLQPSDQEKINQKIHNIFPGSIMKAPKQRIEDYAYNFATNETVNLHTTATESTTHEFQDVFFTADAFYTLSIIGDSEGGTVSSLRKFNLSGKPDTSFGKNGIVVINPQNLFNLYAQVNDARGIYKLEEEPSPFWFHVKELGINSKGQFVLNIDLLISDHEDTADRMKEPEPFMTTVEMNSSGVLSKMSGILPLEPMSRQNVLDEAPGRLLDRRYYPKTEESLELYIVTENKKLNSPFHSLKLRRVDFLGEPLSMQEFTCEHILMQTFSIGKKWR